MESLKDIKVDKIIKQGSSWLLKSGIQNKGKKNLGAFSAWYGTKNKKYSYLYSEISGYLITHMCFMYEYTNKKIYLTSAINSADWLIKCAQDTTGGFKCLFLLDKKIKLDFKSEQIYSFDNGVIINGLVNLYKITKNKKYLNSATKCGNWIVNKAQKKNGEIKPIYDLSKNSFVEDKKKWSWISGSYHTKISIGLLNLYSVNKKKIFLTSSKKIFNTSLKKQIKSGEFLSTKISTNLHPHCYSAEGLWVGSKFLKNKNYLKAVIKSTKWIFKNQDLDGLVPRLRVGKKYIYSERVDALAQSVRLVLLLLKDNKIDKNKFDPQIKKVIKIIVKYQSQSKRLKEQGGFYWGKTSKGKTSMDLNCWVTSFVIQTLILFKYYQANKKFKFKTFYLI